MYDESTQACRLLSWWAHENTHWHRLRDSNLSDAFSGRTAPALPNDKREIAAVGPIGFRIGGVLVCIYKNSCQQ